MEDFNSRRNKKRTNRLRKKKQKEKGMEKRFFRGPYGFNF